MSSCPRSWLAPRRRAAACRGVDPYDPGGHKQARADADDLAVGGMRKPWQSVGKVAGWRTVGARVLRCFDEVSQDVPEAVDVGRMIGQGDYAGPSARVVEGMRERLRAEFDVRSTARPAPKFGPPPKVDADLFGGLLQAANDPDAEVLRRWLSEGAPMGMDAPIEEVGIFPPADRPWRESDEPCPGIHSQWMEGFHHYGSVLDNADAARAEFDRYLQEGFAVMLKDSEVQQLFPHGHLNKLGVIVKTRRDGTQKNRLIVDMRRSSANSRALVPERPLLPRPADVVDDVLDLADIARRGGHAGCEVELLSADFSDAYCHLPTHPAELRNCLVAAPPSPGRGNRGRPGVAVMTRCGFGSKGAPLTWSRVAAALGRLGQAILEAAGRSRSPAGRLNICLDDPLFALLGSGLERDRNAARVLLTWVACGFSISWSKCGRGPSVPWIGLDFDVSKFGDGIVTVRIPKQLVEEVVEEARALLGLSMLPIRRLRRFAGRGGWIVNLVVRARWTIQRLWAAIAAEERTAREAAAGARPPRASRGGGPRHHLVATKQVAPALRWLEQFWGSEDLQLSRTFRLDKPRAVLELVLDASPWGLGGYLAHVDSGVPFQYYEDALTEQDAARFASPVGDSRGQQYWEALNVLVATRLWGRLFAAQQVTLRVRADSLTALRLLVRLASSSPLLNGLGAELALTLETWGIEQVFAQHIPGAMNIIADQLSRRSQPGAPAGLPPALAHARRKAVPPRDAAFFLVWECAVGHPAARRIAEAS